MERRCARTEGRGLPRFPSQLPSISDLGIVPKRVQHSYTTNNKLEVLDWVAESNKMEVARASGIPYDTIRTSVKNEENIRAFSGNKRRKTIGGQGRKEIVPFSQDLVIYMKDARRAEEVSEFCAIKPTKSYKCCYRFSLLLE